MKKTACFVVLILFCFVFQAKTIIFLKLDKVVKAPLTKELKPENGQKFSDETLAITWATTSAGFQFELTNPGKASLTILWDECSFFNEEKKGSKVVHSDTFKQTDIPPMSRYKGVVAPSDYIFWSGKSWTIDPIFPERLSDEQFAKIADRDLIYKVTLVLKKSGRKIIYSFIFKAYAR